MQILRAADRTASPWKNGGGVTWEIAVSPDSAMFDGFDWRLSIAEVASGGPFSLFPDVDRVLTVIKGDGLHLQIAGEDSVVLSQSSPPLAFPGDAACTADLAGAPIRDLNVMVRRGVFRAVVRRADGPLELTYSCEVLAALAMEATEINGHQLHSEDLALAGTNERLQLGPGPFFVIELARA